jgi:hypothetical protein
LYSNNISEISGLDKLTSLNVLSIGKNKFRDHISIFVYLKKLKNNLQVIKMAENNFQKQGSSSGDDYKTMAIITLGKNLKYVDYELITEDERDKAKTAQSQGEAQGQGDDAADDTEKNEHASPELVEAKIGCTHKLFENIIKNSEKGTKF